MNLPAVKRFGILFVLLAEVAILTLFTSSFGPEGFSSTFLNWVNISQVIRALSFIAIMAVGQSVVIISGGIDLSIGSVLGFSGVATAVALNAQVPLLLSVSLGILAGAACGWVNGVLVTSAKLPPFIATLGMMSIARGLAFALTGGQTVRDLPESFLAIGQGSIAGIPVPIVVMMLTALVCGYLLRTTPWGRYVFAIGGNEEAAKYSGINIAKIKLAVYLLCGLLAGVSGVLFTARFGVGQSTAGLGYELDVIAAAVIGGVSLSGGRGTILGAVIGSMLMGILRNGLVLLNVSPYWQQVAIGGVIVLAVMLDRRTKR